MSKMENKPASPNSTYKNLVNQISETYSFGFAKAVAAVNSNMVETYWKIGAHIVEFEQGGKIKAEYGIALLPNLSKDLTRSIGKGFSLSNIKRMRQFYALYPISAELPHQLSWTHFVELLKINDPLERSFYEKQTSIENWSTTDLIRQKKSALYLRLAKVIYAMHNLSSQLFVNKYQLYLPNKEELRNLIVTQLQNDNKD